MSINAIVRRTLIAIVIAILRVIVCSVESSKGYRTSHQYDLLVGRVGSGYRSMGMGTGTGPRNNFCMGTGMGTGTLQFYSMGTGTGMGICVWVRVRVRVIVDRWTRVLR